MSDVRKVAVNPPFLMNAPAYGFSHANRTGDTVYCSGQTSMAEGLEAQAREAFTNVRSLLAYAGANMADIVKISDEDVAYMTGSKDLAKAAKKWLKLGARVVVVTKGGEGVEAFTGRFAIAQPAVKVKVADTVGAGDTFTAGLLAALRKAKLLNKKALAAIPQADLEAALAFAAKAAAVTVSRPGADPPWAKELT